jgi:hypothetical protein
VILCSRSRVAPGPVRYENWCVDRPSRAVAILVLPAGVRILPEAGKAHNNAPLAGSRGLVVFVLVVPLRAVATARLEPLPLTWMIGPAREDWCG